LTRIDISSFALYAGGSKIDISSFAHPKPEKSHIFCNTRAAKLIQIVGFSDISSFAHPKPEKSHIFCNTRAAKLIQIVGFSSRIGQSE
jgi:hypothetical protein